MPENERKLIILFALLAELEQRRLAGMRIHELNHKRIDLVVPFCRMQMLRKRINASLTHVTPCSARGAKAGVHAGRVRSEDDGPGCQRVWHLG